MYFIEVNNDVHALGNFESRKAISYYVKYE